MFFWEYLYYKLWFNMFSSNKNLLYRLCLLEAIKCHNLCNFALGKIQFENFDPCKRFDILQLWYYLQINSF